ncbi:MAG TPA: hypothetical protein VF125_02820 [Solirubrobacterales bacterium]
MIDEATIRRQMSVDFSLDSIRELTDYEEICGRVFGEKLCVAPLFILDKNPGSVLSFDLKDETGRTLSLMTTEENAEVSAATLKVLASRKLERHLRRPLPESLAAKLQKLATSNTTDGEEWLERLEGPFPGDADLEEIECLLDRDNDEGEMRWWLETLAVASIVMVAFDPVASHRRVIKIAFEEPTNPEPTIWAQLAIRSFKVWVFSPMIRSGRYHLDVTAPPDFRLTQVKLFDSKAERPVSSSGFRRRAQLYLDDVHDPRGAISMLALRVSGRGVLGGALVAAILAFVAIAVCAVLSQEIVEGSGDNVALLLVLPGIIATYAARSDQHGLTTRLLAVPRWILLLGSGVAAYYAAGVIALVGSVKEDLSTAAYEKAVDHNALLIKWLLLPAAVIALASALIIFIGWICTREVTHRTKHRLQRTRRAYSPPRFRLERKLQIDAVKVWEHIQRELEERLAQGLFEKSRSSVSPQRNLTVHGSFWRLNWTHGIKVIENPTGATVRWLYELDGPRWTYLLRGAGVRWELSKAKSQISSFEAENGV